MTLVVAKINKGMISIASDTMISEHGKQLPAFQGQLKSICLPKNICVSYSGSPELASRAFAEFCIANPSGTNFKGVVEHFESASRKSGNEFLIAFSKPPKIITIRDGARLDTISKTHWIGDKEAFEAFQQYMHSKGVNYQRGRAVNATLFSDEMSGSPASDLYGAMREIVVSRRVRSVGGFVNVLSNRGDGFRFSSYSDILMDWPLSYDTERSLDLNEPIDLISTGENDRFSISQVTSSYLQMNLVAHYVLKGKLLYLFRLENGYKTQCYTAKNVEPRQVAAVFNQLAGFDCQPLCMIMSARKEASFLKADRSTGNGMGMCLFCEENTFPKSAGG